MRKLLLDFICLGIMIWICIIITRIDTKPKEIEIDLISTITINNQDKLLVVTNRNIINNKVVFAKEIIKNYFNNSFDSIKLSNDLREDIEKVDVAVYLDKQKIEQYPPDMNINYRFIHKEEDINETIKEIEICIDGTTYKVQLHKDENKWS